MRVNYRCANFASPLNSPVPLHGVRRAFVEAEIDEWIASRIAARWAEVA
jgi:hypothetical protein